MNIYRKKGKTVLVLISLFTILYFLTFIFNSVNFIQYNNENEQKFKEDIYGNPLSDEEDNIILDDLNFEDKLPQLSSPILQNYTMIVGNPYSWISAAGGTELLLLDNSYVSRSLPFSFDFYNESYSTIYLGVNGYLSFTDSSPSDFSNDPIPSTDPDNTYLIAPFWDDLLTAWGGGGGTIYVRSFGTYWVAEWLNIEHISGPTVGTFEVILYDNGDIVFNYDYISYVAGGYTCGLNLGLDTSYYNEYSGLTASTNDFSLLFTPTNDYAPQLSAESVIPTTGGQTTQFNFSVEYTDQDNNPPIYVNVTINGTSYSMSQVNPLDNDYTDGCIYQYITYLQPAAFNYTYSFECSDGDNFNSTITYDNLEVIHVNDYGPELLNPQVTPSIGGNSKLFNFTVRYFDDDNNFPVNINITLNSTTTYLMLPVNPLDTNAMDGVLYYFNTTLDFGYYSFQINCSDGVFTNSTGWIIGPEVNPFYGQWSDFTLFYDDFERASLGSDWTHIGGGSYGINTDTFQSPTRSAYHCWNTGEIQSRIFDLSFYRYVNISYWVRQGDTSLGSEQPETGEDFFVEYYNNLGSWIPLDQFLGADPGATIYIRSHQLPADALHSNFQIRFRQFGGSNSDWDWWHFDDVRIDVNSVLNLHLPLNNSIHFNGFINFTWDSLDAYIGACNYTLQISNQIDFSVINIEELNIPETPDNTSILIDVNLAADQYYWRIRPTYGPFYHNWSDVFTFNLTINNFTPNLSSVEVIPLYGSQMTKFNFTVMYSDQDNNPPIYVNVNINGTSYSMSQVNPLDTDYTDGCIFQYLSKLSPATFNYTYSFECYDGKYANSTILYDNLEVIEINLIAPNLINPQLNPSIGVNSTLFNFSVWYYDIENNQLTYINITINDTGTFLMEKADPLDFNATDGILYYYTTTLPWGYYKFQINCSDGVFTNSTGWLIGPEVNPFLGLSDLSTDPIKIVILDSAASDAPRNGIWANLNANWNLYGTYNISIDYTTLNFNGITYNDLVNSGADVVVIADAHSSYDYMLPEIRAIYQYTQEGHGLVGSGVTFWSCTNNDRLAPLFGMYSNMTPSIPQNPNSLDIDPLGYGYSSTILFNNLITPMEGYTGYALNGWQLNFSDPAEFAAAYVGAPTGNLKSVFYGAAVLVHEGGSAGLGRSVFATHLSTYNYGGTWTSEETQLYYNILIYAAMKNLKISSAINLKSPVNESSFFNDVYNFTWSSLDAYFGPCNYTLQISNQIDFSVINIEELNIPETPENTSILIDVNLAADQYYWRVRPTYGPFYYNWSEVYTFNLIINNYTPNLTSVEVIPLSGSQLTIFNFTVIYSDQDNNPPIYVNVIINGTSYLMSQVNPLDTDYTDGCMFQYKTKLSPAVFNYTYSFECYDGKYANSTILYDNLEVIEINLIAPNLINPQLNPSIGVNSTLFNFSVWYYDIENNQLTYINITINNTGIFLMEKADPLDFNATDGILYYHTTTLPWGYYKFQINCSDGVFTNSTEWLIGPEVNPFYGDPILPLLTPLNESLWFTSLFDFTWTSLELPSGAVVNYSLQISNSTDFSFIIFEKENIEELSGVSNLTQYIDYQSGLYYWRVCAIYEVFTSNWSNYYMFNLTYNENIPNLFSGSVIPRTGSQLTKFNFTVVYIDPDNNYPYSITVTINGTSYEMVKVNSADNNYTDGCVYQYLIYLAPSDFNYTYYFECYDGKYTNFTISYNNLEVNESFLIAPLLINPHLNPSTGDTSTLFNFTVWYYDIENNQLTYINITIKNTGTFLMEKINPLDFNATDGILYYYTTTLPWGSYKFQINCSDGVLTNSTGWIHGPEINPPEITIISPIPYQLFGNKTFEFVLYISNTENLYSTWYSLNGGLNYTFSGTTGTINQSAWDACGNGTVIIRFYTNDTVGNINFTEITVRKETSSPNITINLPYANDLFGAGAPKYNVTIDDNKLNTTWYSLNGGLNYTFTSSTGLFNQTAWDACGNGTVIITFYANNTAGNLNSEQLIVRKDIIAPIITINSPFSNDLFGFSACSFDISIIEANLNLTWYTLNGGAKYNFTGTNGIINQTAWDAFGNETIIIRFYANDTLGNEGYEERSVRKYTHIPDITIVSPTDLQTLTTYIINFNLNIDEKYIFESKYSLNGGSNYTFSGSSGTINENAWIVCDNGNVNITFYVENDVGTIGSEKVTVIKNTPLLEKDAYAIIIGIENYPGTFDDLYYCRDDALSINSMLINRYHFKSANIILLLDSAATKSAITNAFSQVSSNIDSEDIFFFYYAGHGGSQTVFRQYICPYDSIPDTPSNRYYDYELSSRLSSFSAAEKYVVIDSCYSGGMISESQSSRRFIMTACDDDESSYESSSFGHGIFTYYFLRSPTYASDSNGDGVKSMEECFSYADARTVIYTSGDQDPQKYDAISGQAVFTPSITSLTLSISGNQLDYSFYIYGTRLIETLRLSVCGINPITATKTINFKDKATTKSGFGYYSGSIILEGCTNITGYEFSAEISDNLLSFNQKYGDTDIDDLYDIDEILEYGTDPNNWDTDGDSYSDGWEVANGYDPLDPDDPPEPDDDDDDDGGGGAGAEEGFLIIILILVAIGVIGFVATIVIVKRKSKSTIKSTYKPTIKGKSTYKPSIKEKTLPESAWFKKPTEKPPIESYRRPYKIPEPKLDINYCTNCGSKVKKEDRFCTNCGTSIESKLEPKSQFDRGVPLGADRAKMKLILKDFILNKTPPPKSQFSLEGKRAIMVAKMANDKIIEGKLAEALNLMMESLRLGVPEPYNTRIKATLLDLLERDF
ncbi:MAG: zinc-ribbon domain-containing protein [Promethearchaeota archaeon]|nr:MAG: zinc-ribbon domain-containing protein [Candidatus Lokiarchaeota archaeon]